MAKRLDVILFEKVVILFEIVVTVFQILRYLFKVPFQRVVIPNTI
jgi:hypothetical protein